MLFNYINLFFEVTAHVFRAIGVCAVLIPVAYFAGIAAFALCNRLSVLMGLIAVSCAIMAAIAVFMELLEAIEEVQAFRYWHAAVQKM